MSLKVGVDLDKFKFDLDGNVIVEDARFAEAFENDISEIRFEKYKLDVVSPCMSGCKTDVTCGVINVNTKKCISVGEGCTDINIKSSRISFNQVLIRNREFSKALIDLKSSSIKHIDMLLETDNDE